MISSLAVDPSDASVLLASKYPEGLIRSNDAGVTWSTLSAEQAGGVWFATSHRAYTLQTPKLYRSDDGGQTWTQVSSLPDGFAALAFDPRDPSVMFAGFSRYVRGGGVYKSTDGGATWMHASEGIHGANIEALSADRRIGAVFVGTASGLYRTIDKGATFQRVGERSARVAESPDGALYAAADQELLRSSDGGLHWEVVREGQVTGPVAIHPKDSRLLVLAATGRLLRSTDRGGTWNEVLCRCEIGSYSTFTSLLFDGDTVLAATQREYKGIGGLFRSTDAGASWTALNAFDTGSLAFDPLHSGALLASVGTQVGRSTDGGQTWTGLYSGKRYIRSLAVDPSGTLWAGASAQCTSSFGLACPRAGGGVLRSGDGGATWTEPHPSIEGLSVRELLVDPRDPNTVYLGSDEGGLWITHSAGR
jgi:photosystem II stability/assembly factor-like uncharacterized protein